MHAISLNNSQSTSLIIKAWLAKHLENFFSKVDQGLIGNLIDNFERIKLDYLADIDDLKDISINEAKEELAYLQKTFKSLEKLDRIISRIPREDLRDSFKSLKKVIFKYEAKLHKISVAENPVIETPESFKLQLSDSGLKAVTKSLKSENAVS